MAQPARTAPELLELVADGAQELVAIGNIGLRLHADGRLAVDHPCDPPSPIADCDEDLDRVGRGAEYRADLGYRLHLVQDIDREALAKHDHERVSGGDR